MLRSSPMDAEARLHALTAALAPLPGDDLVPVAFVRRHLDGDIDGGPAGAGLSGDLLDVNAIADVLDRSVSTARALCAAGEIEAFKMRGREWRASRADVQAFVDAERERHRADSAPSTSAPRSRKPRKLSDWRDAIDEAGEE